MSSSLVSIRSFATVFPQRSRSQINGQRSQVLSVWSTRDWDKLSSGLEHELGSSTAGEREDASREASSFEEDSMHAAAVLFKLQSLVRALITRSLYVIRDSANSRSMTS